MVRQSGVRNNHGKNMPIPQEILRLVERFDSQREAYQSGKYNEAQIRAEFIDPLFKALGWDVHNEQGCAEAYKDVIHEDAIKIGGATEAPDLCFRIGGARKFFIECKKPSINIKDAVHPAYQLRRYAWSARLPLSILTDFDELAVYDCRAKPNKNDSSAIGRLLYFTSKQFAERWDELAAIFSREAVLKGSFDKYAEGIKGRKGTAGVDDAFLEEIERWRDMLARNIALRNEKLSQRELNFAVQRTIDRIVFLRICEDRGIEPYGRLMTLRNGERTYPRLGEFFQRADERYNSGLFHFQQEKERKEAPDELTLKLKIDDKVLKDIVGNLYYPESPYEFSVLPADILGQVYERFLGKVIRLTAGHQAKVEDKPEVRKAGGVYYTPTYIVDYIVKNTVGKLMEDIVSRKGAKSPRNAILQEVAKLKILDPACGSGSFLLGAYQYLLNWHRDYYVQQMKVGSDRRADRGRPGRVSSPIYQSTAGDYRLTTTERKRILLNNIYGVDIDSQAVEVTKLSLLLKVLEGESQETITKQFELFHQRALPDLGSNIKCGNSLIGPDFYKDRQGELFGEDEMFRINAFDWKAELAEIFKAGGFDAVIGNPPYVQAGLLVNYKPYFQSHYTTFTGNADLYVFFIERALNILKSTGKFGYVVSNKWLRSDYGRSLRQYLSRDTNILGLVDFGELPVFRGVGTFPCIIFCSHRTERHVKTLYTAIKSLPPDCEIADQVARLGYSVDLEDANNTKWTFAPQEIERVLRKLRDVGISLRIFCKGRIRRGVLTGYNPAFIIDKATRDRLVHETPAADEVILPFVSGDETRRYSITWGGRYIILSRHGIDIRKYPSIVHYLEQFQKHLEPKKNPNEKVGRKPGNYHWYEIQDSTAYFRDFEKAKIIYGQFQIAPHFSFSPLPMCFGSNHYMIVSEDTQMLLYLSGILNSRLYFFYMKRVAGVLGNADDGGRLISQKSHILDFPVRAYSITSSDKARQDKIVALVNQMLDLHKRVAAAKTDHERTLMGRQISTADREIDRLVYELYGLTEDEIRIVEQSGGK